MENHKNITRTNFVNVYVALNFILMKKLESYTRVHKYNVSFVAL